MKGTRHSYLQIGAQNFKTTYNSALFTSSLNNYRIQFNGKLQIEQKLKQKGKKKSSLKTRKEF